MRLLPVLDIRNGIAVHAVAGRREEYRPLRSTLCDSSNPLDVARAFRDRLGRAELYVADLDAILDERSNVDLWQQLAREGFSLLIDAGIRDSRSAEHVLDSGAHAAIVGLETLPGPELLGTLAASLGQEHLVFSLDLKDGCLLGDVTRWPSSAPLDIMAAASAQGINQFLVLDLAAVGTGAGTPTLPLCRQIATRWQPRRLITGGGIRGPEDLRLLAAAGVTDALIATALHSGQICDWAE